MLEQNPNVSVTIRSKPPRFCLLSAVVTFTFCLIFLIPGASAGGNWSYQCKLADHTDQNGKLVEDDQYTLFICVAINLQIQQTAQYALLVDQEINTVWVFQQPPDSTQFQTIALANPQSQEFGAIEVDTVNQVLENNIEDAVQRHATQVTSTCGSAPFAYSFKSPDQKLWEGVEKEAKKQLKRFQPPELNPQLKKAMPFIGKIAASWPQLLKFWDSLKGYLVLAGTASQFLSASYSEAVKNSVATYEPDPDYDFTNCLVQIVVNTNELLIDMERQNVTTRLFTSQYTIGEIQEDFNSQVTTFQTTGRFVSFDDQAPGCLCPACPGSSTPEPNSFSNCLVDVEIQTDVLIVDVLRLTNTDLNKRLNEESLLSGYFLDFNRTVTKPSTTVCNLITEFNITSNQTLNTAMLIHGNFTGFDTPVGEESSQCGCQSCPPVQTNSSARLGTILVGITNIAITVTLAVTLMGLKHGAVKVYAQSKSQP
ncbi:MAG: hypothetical protein ACR2PT_16295 [Endozoicomonas sp.]